MTGARRPGPQCDRCGRIHITRDGNAACAKHRTKRDEDGNLVPCSNNPVLGCDTCHRHGAAAPQVRAAAQRRQDLEAVEQRARTLVDARGPMTLAEVYERLIHLAGLVTTWQDFMVERVDALKALRYEASGPGTEQLRSEVALMERAMDRTLRVLESIARLDLDTRKAKIDQAQADIVVSLIWRIVDGLFAEMVATGLDRELYEADWARAVGKVVPREIQRILQEHQQ